MNGIIVPTFPRDFHWVHKLLDSAGPEENVIVIFSSPDDYRDFNRPCKYLIVPDKPERFESVVTYKKLEALSQLHTQYDYLATIDSECKFVRPLTPHLKEIWENNCLVANESERGHEILVPCLEDLHIKNYPYSTNLYWWFNDIQVYPTRLIPSFLNWLPKTTIRKDSFDYMMFGIFMVMKHAHKFRILNAKAEYGVIEELGLPSQEANRHLCSQVNWTTWYPYVENIPSIKMLFHLDRYPIT